MRRHIVCLSFDFDAVSGWIARGLTTAGPLSRGEFGPRVGAPRILALLGRHAINATWFVPGHTLQSYPAICEQVIAGGHEIGHHGWSHRSPAGLSPEEEEAELDRADAVIRRMTGQSARGYRSPGWDLSARSVSLLLQRGFTYDSSLMADDYRPYRLRHGDTVSIDQPLVRGAESALLEMPISWSLDDFPHFEFVRTPQSVQQGNRNAGAVLGNWIDDFMYMKRNYDWGVLTYTFHPYVIGRGHRMMLLEQLIERLLAVGCEFMRMEDAAREVMRHAE